MAELSRQQILTSVIAGKGPAYLRGVDLSVLDLSGAGWLLEADLRQTNLSNSDLSRANLRGARLEQANLHSATLVGANLERADLWRAKLNVANFRMANLSGANLREATLVGANLVRADLREAILDEADFEGANLEGANLAGAKLNLANLRMANLRGANLEGTSLVGTIMDDEHNVPQMQVPSQGFVGMLNYVQLSDIIQLICLSRSDLLIRVECMEEQGTIHVRSGQVYHAQSGILKGEDAFVRILNWPNGRFEVLPLQGEQTVSIDKPVEHLIIDAMRQRDEQSLSGNAMGG